MRDMYNIHLETPQVPPGMTITISANSLDAATSAAERTIEWAWKRADVVPPQHPHFPAETD